MSITEPHFTVTSERRRQLLTAGLLLHVFALLLACVIAAGRANAMEVRPVQKAPTLAFETLSGAPVDALRNQGKVQVFNFWAAWCSACREEMPALEKFSQSMRGKAVDVTLVNVGDSTTVIEKYLKKQPVSLPVIRDPQSRALSPENLALQHLPATLVVDRRGNARWILIGKLDHDASELRARVAEALGNS